MSSLAPSTGRGSGRVSSPVSSNALLGVAVGSACGNATDRKSEPAPVFPSSSTFRFRWDVVIASAYIVLAIGIGSTATLADRVVPADEGSSTADSTFRIMLGVNAVFSAALGSILLGSIEKREEGRVSFSGVRVPRTFTNDIPQPLMPPARDPSQSARELSFASDITGTLSGTLEQSGSNPDAVSTYVGAQLGGSGLGGALVLGQSNMLMATSVERRDEEMAKDDVAEEIRRLSASTGSKDCPDPFDFSRRSEEVVAGSVPGSVMTGGMDCCASGYLSQRSSKPGSPVPGNSPLTTSPTAAARTSGGGTKKPLTGSFRLNLPSAGRRDIRRASSPAAFTASPRATQSLSTPRSPVAASREPTPRDTSLSSLRSQRPSPAQSPTGTPVGIPFERPSWEHRRLTLRLDLSPLQVGGHGSMGCAKSGASDLVSPAEAAHRGLPRTGSIISISESGPRSALAKEAGHSAARAQRLRSIATVLRSAADENMKLTDGAGSPLTDNVAFVTRSRITCPEDERLPFETVSSDSSPPPPVGGSDWPPPPSNTGFTASFDTVSRHSSRDSKESMSAASPKKAVARERMLTTSRHDVPDPSLRSSSPSLVEAKDQTSLSIVSLSPFQPGPFQVQMREPEVDSALASEELVFGSTEDLSEEPRLDPLRMRFIDPRHEALFSEEYRVRARIAMGALVTSTFCFLGGIIWAPFSRSNGIAFFSVALMFLELYSGLRLIAVKVEAAQFYQCFCSSWLLLWNILSYNTSIGWTSSNWAGGVNACVLLLCSLFRPLVGWVYVNMFIVLMHAVAACFWARGMDCDMCAAIIVEVLCLCALNVLFVRSFELRCRRGFASSLVLRDTVGRCRVEQKRAFNLVQSCLPQRVLETIMSSGGAWTGVCAQVRYGVVLTTDIANFTQLCTGMSAANVINMLNKLFSHCDCHAQLYGVEKVKTLGDAWIGAVQPADKPEHRIAAANLGLAILSSAQSLPAAGFPAVRIRIGIGEGSLLSGMAGVRRAQFEVLGEALEEATRMESTGIPQKVQVSEKVAAELEGEFLLQHLPDPKPGGSGIYVVRRKQGELRLQTTGDGLSASTSAYPFPLTTTSSLGPPRSMGTQPTSALTQPATNFHAPPGKSFWKRTERVLLGSHLTGRGELLPMEAGMALGLTKRALGGAAAAVVRRGFVDLVGPLRTHLYSNVNGTGRMVGWGRRFNCPYEESLFRESLLHTVNRKRILGYVWVTLCIAVFVEVSFANQMGWDRRRLNPASVLVLLLFASSVGCAALIASGLASRRSPPRWPVGPPLSPPEQHTGLLRSVSSFHNTPPQQMTNNRSHSLLHQSHRLGGSQAAKDSFGREEHQGTTQARRWKMALGETDTRSTDVADKAALLAVAPLLVLPAAAVLQEVRSISKVMILSYAAYMLVLHPSLLIERRILLVSLTALAAVVLELSTGSESAVLPAVPIVVPAAYVLSCLGERQQRKTWRNQQWLTEQQADIDRNVGISEEMLFNAVPEEVLYAFADGLCDLVHDVDEATVGFLLIDNLVKIDSTACPAIVVPTLNTFLGSLDALLERHGVQKLKNLPYIVVSGCPLPRANHARAVVGFAVDAVEWVNAYNTKHGTSVNIKVGVHSGKLSAGVLGTTNFIYDVFGDSVNTASRLASNGVSYRVQVSQETADLVPEMGMEPRGTVVLKGKGPVPCFLVSDREVPISHIGSPDVHEPRLDEAAADSVASLPNQESLLNAVNVVSLDKCGSMSIHSATEPGDMSPSSRV
eukprot:Hpha_TRINITY_DN16452_c1_g4::TRINITY_DN16452_c1_g4_i1::g.161452::m.161452